MATVHERGAEWVDLEGFLCHFSDYTGLVFHWRQTILLSTK